MLQVVEGAKQIATTVDKIADAADEQAASIAQVTQGKRADSVPVSLAPQSGKY